MKRTIFKLLRYGFFGLVSLIAFLVLIVVEESFRGKRAWENYKRDAMARGQKFDSRAFIPPPVPDDQNFAMTPLLKPLFGKDRAYVERLNKRMKLPEPKAGKEMPSMGDRVAGKPFNPVEWNEYLGDPDVLHALKRFDPEMDEISTASRKPYSRFPLREEDGIHLSFPHLSPLISISKLFAVRGAANLAQGHPSEAFDDYETLLRVAKTVKDEATLVSTLAYIKILDLSEDGIWHGLSTHQWSEEQLGFFQANFQCDDPLGKGLRSLQFEMAEFSTGFEKICLTGEKSAGSASSRLGRGWIYQNMILFCQFSEKVFPAVDPSRRRFYPHTFPSAVPVSIWGADLHNPYSVLMLSARPAVWKFIPQCAYAQTAVDEAAIACALERYRLVHNEYPENLNALVPQYFSKLPLDVITGQPLHYNRTGDGRFILYSVGWNETDDHGTVVMREKSSGQDIIQGDWVWR